MLYWVQIVNKLFIFLALLALIVEFSVFLFEHWYLSLCLFLQLSFLVLNLCIHLLHEDSLGFWYKYRNYLIYVPCMLITVLTLLELSLMGVLLQAKLDEAYSQEEQKENQSRLYLSLA